MIQSLFSHPEASMLVRQALEIDRENLEIQEKKRREAAKTEKVEEPSPVEVSKAKISHLSTKKADPKTILNLELAQIGRRGYGVDFLE